MSCQGNSITIPKGDKGDTGATGPQGANGSNGVPGINGSQPFKYIKQVNIRGGSSPIVSISEADIPFASFSTANISNTYLDVSISFWVSFDGGNSWTPTYIGGTVVINAVFASTGLTISFTGLSDCLVHIIIFG